MSTTSVHTPSSRVVNARRGQTHILFVLLFVSSNVAILNLISYVLVCASAFFLCADQLEITSHTVWVATFVNGCASIFVIAIFLIFQFSQPPLEHWLVAVLYVHTFSIPLSFCIGVAFCAKAGEDIRLSQRLVEANTAQEVFHAAASTRNAMELAVHQHVVTLNHELERVQMTSMTSMTSITPMTSMTSMTSMTGTFNAPNATSIPVGLRLATLVQKL